MYQDKAEMRFRIVKMLLKAGHDPNIRDLNTLGSMFSILAGSTPLMKAAEKGDLELVDILLRHGADPNLSNNSGEFALLLASQYGHDKVVERLLDKTKTERPPFSRLAYVDKNSEDGSTALHFATRHKHPECVRQLLRADANDVRGGKKQQTPLQTAMDLDEAKMRLGIVKMLLDAGFSANVRDPGDGSTPLMKAAKKGDLAVVDILLQYGADPNLSNKKNGLTALHFATLGKHPECVRALLDAGANKNALGGEKQQTPLEIAEAAANTAARRSGGEGKMLKLAEVLKLLQRLDEKSRPRPPG